MQEPLALSIYTDMTIYTTDDWHIKVLITRLNTAKK